MPNDLIPARGRLPSASVLMEVVRPLTASDIIALAAGATTGPRTGVQPLKTLKSLHHRAARLLAAGKSVKDVAFAVGRTPQRISDLQADPAFAELVAIYSAELDAVIADENEAMIRDHVHINELVREEIIDRLEDPALRAAVPLGELRQLLSDTSDRTGAPKKQSAPTIAPPTSITFNIAGRAKLRDDPESAQGPIVDIEAESTDS